MWDKTDIYPYHRKTELAEDKPTKFNIMNLWYKMGQAFKTMKLEITGENVAFLVISFLLTRAVVLGDTLPFGVAVLVAAIAAKKTMWPFLFGIVAGLTTVSNGPILFGSLLTLGLLGGILTLYPQAIKKSWFIAPALVFAVTVVVKGTLYMIIEPILYNTILVLVEALLAAGLTIVFSMAFTTYENKGFNRERLTAEELGCYMVLGLGIVIGLSELTLLGISLKGIISRFAIMAVALLYGIGGAAVIGVLVGVIPSFNNMLAPAAAGIYAFSGVLAGVFRQFEKVGVIVGFFLGSLVFSVYMADQEAITFALIETAIAAGLLLIIPFQKLEFLDVEQDWSGRMKLTKERKGSNQDVFKLKVKEMSQIFKEVARTFEEVTSTVPCTEDDDLNFVKNVQARVCKDCKMHTRCYEVDKSKTKGGFEQVVKLLKLRGNVDLKLINPSFQKSCLQINALVMTANCLWDAYQVNKYWQQKIKDTQTLVPEQLKGVSQIMENLLEEMVHQRQTPKELENQINRTFRANNININKVNVANSIGEGADVTISQKSCFGKHACTEKVAPLTGQVVGKNLKVTKIKCDYQDKNSVCCYRLTPALNYKLTVGTAGAVKSGSSVSGDNYSTMPLKDGRFAIMLSDGMGTGSKAAMESRTTISLLEHLLESGFDVDLAVRTINSILVLRSTEDSFATLDLAIIDQYSGEAEITKIGAPPSLLKRGGRVFQIKANSLPIGILNTIESNEYHETLQSGDLLVMLSDGILEANNELVKKEEWVIDLLSKMSSDDPQEIAEQILFQARVYTNEKSKDDMTALVARVDSRLH